MHYVPDFLHRNGIVPDIIAGDFDSVDDDSLDEFSSLPDVEMLRLNPVKDDTDTEFVIREAIRRGATSISILGATGTRLDHVLASGQDINVMVFDTELYSNTGGQSSKATPTGSIAKFAAGGKAIKKKDLASIAMSYGYVYVAQIAMGADFNQCVKAIAEAEAYEGPSLIIAYAPCINHGIKAGMGSAQTEEERAVKSGYWHLFRYNPDLKEVGKNAFVLDSKIPTLEYQDFLDGEVRYSALKGADPEKAAELFGMAEAQAKERMEYLQKLVTLYGAAEEK